MTIMEFADKHFDVIGPCLFILVITPIVLFSGESIGKIITAVLGEFRQLAIGQVNRASANALFGILGFVILLVFISKGSLEILGGALPGHQPDASGETVRALVLISGLVILCLFFVISLKLCK